MARTFEVVNTNQKPANWMGDLSVREQKQVEFSRLYAQHFEHVADGHNSMLIIAKLAEKLDAMEAARSLASTGRG